METCNELALLGNWLQQQRHQADKDKRYKVLSNTGENRAEYCAMKRKDFDSTCHLMHL